MFFLYILLSLIIFLLFLTKKLLSIFFGFVKKMLFKNEVVIEQQKSQVFLNHF